MAYLTDRKYAFTASALAKDTFAVVDFTGEESLSAPYRFDIRLVTENAAIDLDAMMESSAKFTIHRDAGDDVTYSGILSAFEQQHAVDRFVFYRATLVPKLWWLSLTHHNQVFMGKTVQEMISAVLKDGGLTTLDYEFRLQGAYAPQPFVCQYGESHLDFIHRWLAREGVYYYFEQTGSGEKTVFTDTPIAHRESRHGRALRISPPSGLSDAHRTETVQGFVCRQRMLPKKVVLKDYNYRKPGMEMVGSAEVDPKGRGERFVYGEHFRTPEDGNRLAEIRAQALLCRKREFIGESTVPYVAPGFTFTLEDHFRASFNEKYLTAEMTHAGSQTGYLIAGIQQGLSDRERTVFYRNQFTAIPASVQFRATASVDRPKITGTLNAKIDGAGSGQYAELDDQGRYKVILPFDMSGRKDGKASTWLRMIQPYAGSDHGMHFPLHKGTEVLLTFVDGNPDRPIIAGAAPNPETPSPVTGADQTMSKLTTAGGNKIHMEDKEGSQRILLHTPTTNTFIRLGAPNDPESGLSEAQKEQVEELIGKGAGEWGANLVSEKGIHIQAGGKNEIILGEEFGLTTGSKTDVTLINANDYVVGLKTEIMVGGVLEFVMALKLALEIAACGTYGPHKFSLRGSHERAEANHSRVVGEQIQALGQRVETAGEAIHAQGQRVDAVGEQIQAKDQVIRALAEEISANANSIRANGETIQAHGESIQAHGESINAHGQDIQTIGSTMKTAGSKLEAVASAMYQGVTKLDMAASKLESGGIAMRTQTLIVDG